MFMTIERQFTINELADRLKLNERTIRRWIKSGRLTAIKIPGRGRKATEYRIPQHAIEALGFRVTDEAE